MLDASVVWTHCTEVLWALCVACWVFFGSRVSRQRRSQGRHLFVVVEAAARLCGMHEAESELSSMENTGTYVQVFLSLYTYKEEYYCDEKRDSVSSAVKALRSGARIAS